MSQHTGGNPAVSANFGNANTCRPITGDWNGNGQTTVGTACKDGNQIRWDLINVQRSGSPAHTFKFATGNSYQPSGGWLGPDWPNWPTF